MVLIYTLIHWFVTFHTFFLQCILSCGDIAYAYYEHALAYSIEEAVEVHMYTVSIGGIKQDVLSMSVPQAQDIAHHGDHRRCVRIGLATGIPTQQYERTLQFSRTISCMREDLLGSSSLKLSIKGIEGESF